jgi:hypothetical protein
MEIALNDFRLGNYIQDKYGNLKSVEALSASLGIEVKGGIPFEIYEPISLNSEWLLGLGFCACGTSWLHISEHFSGFDVQLMDDQYFLNTDGLPFSNGFTYVHQLQNLYYAMTGRELRVESLAHV